MSKERRPADCQKPPSIEAGHAVVAVWERRAFRSVSIEPDEDSYGRVIHGSLPKWFRPEFEIDSRAQRLIESHTRILMAGFLAARKATGRGMGFQSDLRMAGSLADYMHGSERQVDAFLDYQSVIVEDRLDGFLWPGVEALAEELLRVRHLTSLVARRLINAALISKRRGSYEDLQGLRQN